MMPFLHVDQLLRNFLVALLLFATFANAVLLPARHPTLLDVADRKWTFRAANYYQDNMVLQRGNTVIWGYGEPDQNVTVQFDRSFVSTLVQGNGKWSAVLRLSDAFTGGPYDITLKSTVEGHPDEHVIYSVLVGDVWLCSGQSNMYMKLPKIFNGSNELKRAEKLIDMRVMQVALSESKTELEEPDIAIGWTVPNALTLQDFSALCWATGRRLYQQLKIPFGLVQSAYGGTPIRAWSGPDVIERCSNATTELAASSAEPGGPSEDSVLWNAMIAPLTRLHIKGVLWYQGEQDADGNPDAYLCLFPVMIESWRKAFQQPEMPFGFVQLAPKNPDEEQVVGGTAWVRWHQTADVGFVPNEVLRNVFMAVAMDLPDPTSPFGSIHPRYKEEIAERLSRGAMHVAYNITTGPDFQGPRITFLTEDEHGWIWFGFDRLTRVVQGALELLEVCLEDLPGFGGKSCSWTVAELHQSRDPGVFITRARTEPPRKVLYMRYAWKVRPCPYMGCEFYADDESKLPVAPFLLPVPYP